MTEEAFSSTSTQRCGFLGPHASLFLDLLVGCFWITEHIGWLMLVAVDDPFVWLAGSGCLVILIEINSKYE